MNAAYRDQVRLLLKVLPLVAEEEALALKGGTAINLFERDMPRLSVDIDLTYLPFERTSRGTGCDFGCAEADRQRGSRRPSRKLGSRRCHCR